MITDWAGYFGAQAGAFAALTGLVFVALSINLKPILAQPGLSGRAGEALTVLVGPVAIALVGLMPHQSTTALGAEILVIAVVALLTVIAIIRSGWKAILDRPRRERAIRMVAPLATGLLVVAGALLTAGVGAGLYWQAAGAITCLVVGTADAWVLLVEILR